MCLFEARDDIKSKLQDLLCAIFSVSGVPRSEAPQYVNLISWPSPGLHTDNTAAESGQILKREPRQFS